MLSATIYWLAGAHSPDSGLQSIIHHVVHLETSLMDSPGDRNVTSCRVKKVQVWTLDFGGKLP